MKGAGPKICCIAGCGKKHVGMGLCMGHYTRQREGRALDTPLLPGGGRVVKSTARAVNARVSVETWETLTALASARDISTYQFVSDLLESAARRRRGELDAARAAS